MYKRAIQRKLIFMLQVTSIKHFIKVFASGNFHVTYDSSNCITDIQYSLFKDTVGSKALHKHTEVFFLLILISSCHVLLPLGLVQDLW